MKKKESKMTKKKLFRKSIYIKTVKEKLGISIVLRLENRTTGLCSKLVKHQQNISVRIKLDLIQKINNIDTLQPFKTIESQKKLITNY